MHGSFCVKKERLPAGSKDPADNLFAYQSMDQFISPISTKQPSQM
jgi:hypothetical protein